MPLRGNKFRTTTSSRVILVSWKKSWFVVRGSWLVKACHYTRMGCDEISQRAVQGSLYRGAGRQRRSERLKVGPYECPDWGYFCGLRPATSELHLFHESVAAERHIRRGRPKGVPLRAEGFSKRRCQFESVAAKPHLSPRKAKRGCRIKTASLHHHGASI